MVKIVHCADMHFDTPFTDLPSEIAEIRRAELLSSFDKIIKFTGDYKADALLIPGDIFESEYVSYQTVEFLKRCFAHIPNIPVFISPGNHDAMNENEIYNKINFGENVYIFGDGIECFTFEEKGFRVFGHGYTNKYESSSYWNDFSCPDDGLVNIFVGHCCLPPYTEERFSPISISQLENSGLHYFAAGHIHNHEGFKKAGKTTYAYCGIPEGRKFDEDGPRGIIAGELSCKECSLRFVPISARQLITLEIDISDCLTYDDILNKINTEPENMYRLFLTGTKRENIDFDINALKHLLSSKAFYVKIIDKSSEESAHEPGLLENSFLAALKEKNKNTEIVKLAEYFGTAALRGRPIVHDERLVK